MVYASAHLSLAVLEALVHTDPDALPDDLTAFEVEVPDGLAVERVEVEDLPEAWAHGVECPVCREIGERWTSEGRAVALIVPSAVVPEEANVLLNPRHPAAAGVRVAVSRPFAFDPRLVGER